VNNKTNYTRRRIHRKHPAVGIFPSRDREFAHAQKLDASLGPPARGVDAVPFCGDNSRSFVVKTACRRRRRIMTNRERAPAERTGRADNAVEPAVCLLPGDLTWSPKPAFHGLETAVLAGDPNGPGMYAERVRMPAKLRLAPHSHLDQVRMITVLSGTLYFAFGEVFDDSKLKPLPAGTFFVEPKGMAHYAMTKDEVILQLDAIGPTGTLYVEPTKYET
jgi:quercetin dioxygenase-like cupin family protein